MELGRKHLHRRQKSSRLRRGRARSCEHALPVLVALLLEFLLASALRLARRELLRPPPTAQTIARTR
eukprot:1306861-Pleurochrysis_carterae.AAC.2